MGLNQYFDMQDRVTGDNRRAFGEKYDWLDAAVWLLVDLQDYMNTDSQVVAIRREEEKTDPVRHRATNTVVNLLNDATGSLINGTRLTLFGAHPDALALIRSAFEACCYAEYFAQFPERADDYNKLGIQLATDSDRNIQRDVGRLRLRFGDIRQELEKQDGRDRSKFYARLCNLGVHATSARVGLRLSSYDYPVLAWVSKGSSTWTHNCAISLMAVTRYAMELPFERYPSWFSFNPSLQERCQALVNEYQRIAP